MPSSPRANITPDVLTWAREQAQLSIEEAAKKVAVRPERFAAWEDVASDALPTIKQLRKIAKVLHRPASLFYLSERPAGFQPMKDLRRLPGDGLLSFSYELAYEMELAQQRREISLDLSEGAGEEIQPFALAAGIDDEPEVVGARIRRALNVRFSAQSTWRQHGPLEPFKSWRRRIEQLDVLVFQLSRVASEEASGFALATRKRPIIGVNRSDSPNRRTYSLLHEFAHLMLGVSGASDLDVDATRPPETQKVEVFCNAVAAAALIPAEEILGMPSVRARGTRSTDWNDDELHQIANTFGVSRVAVLRRLLTFGRTTQPFYETKASQWHKEWLEEQERRKRQLKASKKPFARNPPMDAFHNLGRPFVQIVLNGMHTNAITASEASRHLGNLRVKHFQKLEQQLYSG